MAIFNIKSAMRFNLVESASLVTSGSVFPNSTLSNVIKSQSKLMYSGVEYTLVGLWQNLPWSFETRTENGFEEIKALSTIKLVYRNIEQATQAILLQFDGGVASLYTAETYTSLTSANWEFQEDHYYSANLWEFTTDTGDTSNMLSTKEFYFPNFILESINNGTLINGTQEIGFRQQIKSIKVKFSASNAIELNCNGDYQQETTLLEGSEVELLNGTKYPLTSLLNVNYVKFYYTEHGLLFILPPDIDENNTVSIEFSNYTVQGDNAVRITNSVFSLGLDGFASQDGLTSLEVANDLGNSITLSETPVTWSGTVTGTTWKVPRGYFTNNPEVLDVFIATTDGLAPNSTGSNIDFLNTKIIVKQNSTTYPNNNGVVTFNYLINPENPSNNEVANMTLDENGNLVIAGNGYGTYTLCTHPTTEASGAVWLELGGLPGINGSTLNTYFGTIAYIPATSGMHTSWVASAGAITALINGGFFGLEEIKLTTIDGLAVNFFSNNLDELNSYMQISGEKYYFRSPAENFNQNIFSIVNNNLVLDSNSQPYFWGPDPLSSTNYGFGFYGAYVDTQIVYYMQVQFTTDSWATSTSVSIPFTNQGYNTFNFLESYMPVNGVQLAENDFISVDEKVVANVTVDPTVTAVTYNGGSALPVDSVLRNTATGQKFIKISGGATAFAAIPIQVKPEWQLSQAGSDAWDVMQSL